MKHTQESLDKKHKELLHYINKKLIRNGGEYPVDALVFEFEDDFNDVESDHLTSSDVHMAIDESKGEDEVSVHEHITIEHKDNTSYITDVETVGKESDTIKSLFGQMESNIEEVTLISDVHQVEDIFKDKLEDKGINTLQKLSNADIKMVESAGHEAWQTQTRDVKDWSTHDGTKRLFTKPESETLRELEIDNEYTLLNRPTEEIISETPNSSTITVAQIEEAKTGLRDQYNVRTFSRSRAEDVIETAEVKMPIGPDLAQDALKNRSKRVEQAGTAKAVVKQIDNETETVGKPIVEVEPEKTVEDKDAVYMSELNINEGSAVNTGLTVLQDRPEYPHIPRTETESSGNAAMPIDEHGNVIKPAVPLEPDYQRPLDELIAKGLANNEVVGLEGHRGAGKNYLIKYIAYKTNRGYRSFDAKKGMTATDLFGPITPDEEGKVTPQNRQLKQGLLNGDIIVINEFSAMPPGVSQALHQLFNDGEVSITAHGEHIKPHPEARIVVTKNPATIEYPGNNELNSATLGRIRMYRQEYIKDTDTETEVISRQVNGEKTYVKKDTIKDVVEFAHRTRKEANDWPMLSTRNVKQVCEEVKKGFPAKGAIKSTLRDQASSHHSLDRAFESIGSIR